MLFNFFKKTYYKNIIKDKKILRIVCGAGDTKYDGWISLNINVLDITKESDFKFLFFENSIDNILLEHVVEHLEYDKFIHFLQIVKKYLKKGAVVRIAVPDKYHPSQYVKNLTGTNGSEPGADDHKYFYCIDDLVAIGEKNKFSVNKIEYFDKNGIFHCNNFSYDNGYISRCSKNYKGRFTENKDEYLKMISTTPEELRSQFNAQGLSYASLLVDLINQ